MGNSILQRSVLVYVFFFLATAQFAQSSKEAEIRKIEEMERMAIQNQDTVAMDKIWSKDLSVNSTGNNVVGKEEGMFALKNGFIHYSTYQKEADKISMFGNLGIAMGLETVTHWQGPKGRENGQKTPYEYMDAKRRRMATRSPAGHKYQS